MDYQEYPKTLNHPAYRHARKIADATPMIPARDGQPMVQAQPEQWEPSKYDPVTVATVDEEEYYLAKGYEAPGKIDPAAFSKAHASPYVAGRAHSEYPKMVNGVLTQDPSAPTSNFQDYPKWVTSPKGEQVIAASAEEEAKILAGPGNQPPEEEERHEEPPEAASRPRDWTTGPLARPKRGRPRKAAPQAPPAE